MYGPTVLCEQGITAQTYCKVQLWTTVGVRDLTQGASKRPWVRSRRLGPAFLSEVVMPICAPPGETRRSVGSRRSCPETRPFAELKSRSPHQSTLSGQRSRVGLRFPPLDSFPKFVYRTAGLAVNPSDRLRHINPSDGSYSMG